MSSHNCNEINDKILLKTVQNFYLRNKTFQIRTKKNCKEIRDKILLKRNKTFTFGTKLFKSEKKLRNRCARQKQLLLFDLFKTFHFFESSHKSNFFLRKDLFSFMRAQLVLSYHLILVLPISHTVTHPSRIYFVSLISFIELSLCGCFNAKFVNI